ncbi:MAG: glutathione S-transferase family protein [Alphaproteobacteria bacterium]|nr:glutathione S-transferase family protein [Alphaproteobacteria bacterium]
MKLFTSPTSPFARKVRILIDELGVTEKIEMVDTAVWSPDTDFRTVNPIGKIPALLVEGRAVVADSTLICSYIDEQFGNFGHHGAHSDGSWIDVAQWQNLADGVMDASILWFIEIARRTPETKAQWWIDRQHLTITTCLAYMEAHLDQMPVRKGDKVNIAQISLVCALGYLDLRFEDYDWRAANPKLATWMRDISTRPSVASTAPPK